MKNKKKYQEIYNIAFLNYNEVLENSFLLMKKDLFDERELIILKSILNLSTILLRATEKSLTNNKIKFDNIINGKINIDLYLDINEKNCKELSLFCEDESQRKSLNRNLLGQYNDFKITIEKEIMEKNDFDMLLCNFMHSLKKISQYFLSDYKEVRPSNFQFLYLKRLSKNESFFEPLISDLAQLLYSFFDDRNNKMLYVEKISVRRRLYCNFIGKKHIDEIRSELQLFDISFESKILKA